MSRLVPLVLLVLLAASCATDEANTSPAPAQTDPTSGTAVPKGTTPIDTTQAVVVHVDDGDSIIVEVDGQEERVRLIGINAPEQGECIGDTSRQALTDAIAGQSVGLERDAEDVDQFGRLLRYVWHDGLLVNEWLAAEGLALARAFEPNTARQRAIDAAGESARRHEAGIWNPNACGPAADGSFTLVQVAPNPPGRDEENLNGEFVVLVNSGNVDVDMTGYVLRDGSSRNRFEFPARFIARTGNPFTVAVGCGEDTDDSLHWCHSTPVWDNSGDEVLLTDPNGNVVLFETYQDER